MAKKIPGGVAAVAAGMGPAMDLTHVLDALRDPLRREMVRRLASEERLCSSFADLGSASGLSYHFTRLRTAGLTNTRKAGTCKLISLRAAELERVFPGLLRAVLRGAERELPNRAETVAAAPAQRSAALRGRMQKAAKKKM